jgi:hypothetical protein
MSRSPDPDPQGCKTRRLGANAGPFSIRSRVAGSFELTDQGRAVFEALMIRAATKGGVSTREQFAVPPRTIPNEVLAEGVGFEPTREREPPAGFQDRCLKPLGHPSIALSGNAFHSILGRERNAVCRRFATECLPPFIKLSASRTRRH